MAKKFKNRSLIEWGVMLTVFGILYAGGWHTELIGKVQEGLLLSGLMSPSVEIEADESPAGEIKGSPEADFDLKLRDQNGALLDMEDLRGKVIFLNLWATWCPPCIAEMPGINKLVGKMEGVEVVFLMVSLDKEFEKAKAFRQRKDFSFDVYEPVGSMPKMYYSQSIPTTYVISAAGELVWTHKGMAEYNTKEFQEFLISQQ